MELIDDLPTKNHILAYKRSLDDQTLIILLNFSEEKVMLDDRYRKGKIVFSMGMRSKKGSTISHLPSYAGAIIDLQY